MFFISNPLHTALCQFLTAYKFVGCWNSIVSIVVAEACLKYWDDYLNLINIIFITFSSWEVLTHYHSSRTIAQNLRGIFGKYYSGQRVGYMVTALYTVYTVKTENI